MSQISQILFSILIFCLAWLVNSERQEGPGEPLYLSPLISSGRIDEAQAASQVSLPLHPSIISHSGFITVNPDFNSNLFFWYFPAENHSRDNSTVPVVLWLDGGPGQSCMFTVFGVSGPFLPESDGDLNFKLNPFSWHKDHHVIYIDNPVNVGFSHTRSPEGAIDSPEGAAKDIHSFLLQFFKMFPNLKENPFYLAGVSYGGAYEVNLARVIYEENEKNEKINLIGLQMDSPWIDAFYQSHWGEVLSGAGLISPGQKQEYEEREALIRQLITNGNYSEAFPVFWDLARIRTPAITGFDAFYNMIEAVSLINMTSYVTLNETRRALHVGGLEFKDVSFEQLGIMQAAMMQSQSEHLDFILQHGYKIMIMVGNADVITGHVGVRNVIEGLSWGGRDEFLQGERDILHSVSSNEVVGYLLGELENVSIVLMRNAGHGVYGSHPEDVLKIVSDFFWGAK